MSSNITIERICQQCGEVFKARTTVTKFCSHTCSKKAWKAKDKAGKVEQSNRETHAIRQRPVEAIKAKEFLTVPDLAKLLSCSKRTAYYLINRGSIDAVNLAERKTLIRRSEIDKLFEQPKSERKELPEPIPVFVEGECYNVADIRKKYNISQPGLRKLILKHNIPTFYKGWFAFVPKKEIDRLLN